MGVAALLRKRQYQAKHGLGKHHHYEEVDDQRATNETNKESSKFKPTTEITPASGDGEFLMKPNVEKVHDRSKSEKKSSMKNVLYEPGRHFNSTFMCILSSNYCLKRLGLCIHA